MQKGWKIHETISLIKTAKIIAIDLSIIIEKLLQYFDNFLIINDNTTFSNHDKNFHEGQRKSRLIAHLSHKIHMPTGLVD